jgi:hypothetical protein
MQINFNRRRSISQLAMLALFATLPAFGEYGAMAQKATGKNGPVAATADLRIQEFVFPAGNDKSVRVRIENAGRAASPLCVLRLTVRKINGVPAGRVAEIKLPPLAPSKAKWLFIDARSILPNNISLESTTFKLNADATSIVTESNEANNEVWHNL